MTLDDDPYAPSPLDYEARLLLKLNASERRRKDKPSHDSGDAMHPWTAPTEDSLVLNGNTEQAPPRTFVAPVSVSVPVTKVVLQEVNGTQTYLPPQPVYLSIIDSRHARCQTCSLEVRKREEGEVLAQIGPKYQPGGLMLVGEAPGSQETRQRKPFVGQAGRILDNLLAYCGIDRAQTVVSNALLCRPPGNKIDDAPFAVEHCNTRLQEEIWAYRPRVILALGNHAVRALAGLVVVKNVQEEKSCPNCEGAGQVMIGNALWMAERTRQKRAAALSGGLEALIPCKHCKGKGQRKVKRPLGSLSIDRGIMELAGAIIDIYGDPQYEHLKGLYPPETKYILGTYHPSFLMRERDKQKNKAGGTAFMPYACHHMKRAASLLTRDYEEKLDAFIVAASHVDTPKELEAFFAPLPAGYFTIDIETEPMAGVPVLEHQWATISMVNPETGEVVTNLACERCGAAQGGAPAECSDSFVDPDADDSRKRTDPLQEALVCVGISRSDTGQILVLDTRGAAVNWPSMQVLQRFLEDPTAKKNFHNGAFDVAVLEARFSGLEAQSVEQRLSSRVPVVRVEGWTNDTMVLSKNIWPDVSKGKKDEEVGIPLDWVGHTYTDCRPWKPKQKAAKKKGGRPIFESFEELALYNARDVRTTNLALSALWDEAFYEGIKPEQVALDVKLQQVAVDMQRIGLPIDEAKVQEIVSKCHTLIATHKQVFAELAGRKLYHPVTEPEGLNLDSPQQLAAVLFDDWRLPASRMNAGRNGVQTRSTAFDVLQEHKGHPGIDALLEVRRLGQIVKLIGSWQPLVRNGFLHPSWRAAATVTGRFSSKPNCFDGETEILTDEGWIAFRALKAAITHRGDNGNALRVAQWLADEPVSPFEFVVPTAYIEEPSSGSMVWLYGPRTDLMVTEDHRCLLFDAAQDTTYSDAVQSRHTVLARDYPVGSAALTQLFALEDGFGADQPNQWSLGLAPLTYVKKMVGWLPTNERVYCVSVPSGVIVIRRNGKISITHQSQNWPSSLKGVGNMRSIVRAPPGWLLVGSDYAALEMRIMGALTGAKLYHFVNKPDDDSRKYDPDYDCHSHVCREVFGARFLQPELFFKPEEQAQYANDPVALAKAIVNQKKVLRNDTKRVVYARNYGSGVETIWDIVKEEDPKCPRDKIEHIVRAYDMLFPELPKYRERALAEALATKSLWSKLLRRRRKFPYGEISPTDAANFGIQSSASDIVNLRTIELLKHLPIDCHLILQGHDSLTVLCPEGKADAVKTLMNQILPCTYDLGFGPMFFDASAQVGSSWDQT